MATVAVAAPIRRTATPYAAIGADSDDEDDDESDGMHADDGAPLAAAAVAALVGGSGSGSDEDSDSTVDGDEAGHKEGGEAPSPLTDLEAEVVMAAAAAVPLLAPVVFPAFAPSSSGAPSPVARPPSKRPCHSTTEDTPATPTLAASLSSALCAAAARRGAQFVGETKMHDGLHPIAHKFEALLCAFFAADASVHVPMPLPAAAPVADAFATTLPLRALPAAAPVLDCGAPVTWKEAPALMATPAGSTLAAWESVEASYYGIRAARLLADMAASDDGGERAAAVEIGSGGGVTAQPLRSEAEVAEAAALAASLGFHLVRERGAWALAAPSNLHGILAAADERDARVARVILAALTPSPPADADQPVAMVPGRVTAAVAHLQADDLPAGAAAALPVRKTVFGAFAPTHAPGGVAPPAEIQHAVAAVAAEPRFAGGDALVLRALAALAEDLELRLRRAILEAAVDEMEGAGKPAAPAAAAAAAPAPAAAAAAAAAGGAGESGDDWSPLDASDMRASIAMRKAHALAYDASADASAAAYAARAQAVSVPVLATGGGSCTKIAPQHLLLINQLAHLLRHAVRAFPAAPERPATPLVGVAAY